MFPSRRMIPGVGAAVYEYLGTYFGLFGALALSTDKVRTTLRVEFLHVIVSTVFTAACHAIPQGPSTIIVYMHRPQSRT